jgi:hypothetical protein
VNDKYPLTFPVAGYILLVLSEFEIYRRVILHGFVSCKVD